MFPMGDENAEVIKKGGAVIDWYLSSGLECMSLEQKRFFLVYNLLSEVGNGGLWQYLFNSTGHLAPQAADALDSLGFDRSAVSVRLSYSRFPEGLPPVDWEERRSVMDAIEESAAEEWDDLSKVVWEESEAITQRLNQLL